MSVRRSYTAVVERNQTWQGQFATEPYEAAWASEAIFFVRVLDSSDASVDVGASVQISPDGMRWNDEGSTLHLLGEVGRQTFVKVTHFGGWLRLSGELPHGKRLTVIIYLTLKE